MNLYQIISPTIGNKVLIVKAENPNQASEVARDVIEENHFTDETRYTLYINELVPPDNDGAGYCYPSIKTHTILSV